MALFARWLRRWREVAEERALARRAIPDDLWHRTLMRYPFLRRRDAAQATRLRRLASLFLDRKEFSAASGMRLGNDVVVAVAAQACLPVLELGLSRYDGFVGIVLHRDAVVVRRAIPDEDGIVHEYDEVLSGEAVQGGPLMLSWRDVRQAGSRAAEGYNVVIHEFAHVLDMADGLSDGVPALPREIDRRHWLDTVQAELQHLRRQLDDGEPTVLDPYGSEGEDEFFAVASEAFFVSPRRLRDARPALYALLARFYRQDPAADMP